MPHRPPSSQAAGIQVPQPRASSAAKTPTEAVTPAAAVRHRTLPGPHWRRRKPDRRQALHRMAPTITASTRTNQPLTGGEL
ncbi:hypothetical protein SBADM41S_09614 [Streptomyces badius]